MTLRNNRTISTRFRYQKRYIRTKRKVQDTKKPQLCFIPVGFNTVDWHAVVQLLYIPVELSHRLSLCARMKYIFNV